MIVPGSLVRYGANADVELRELHKRFASVLTKLHADEPALVIAIVKHSYGSIMRDDALLLLNTKKLGWIFVDLLVEVK